MFFYLEQEEKGGRSDREEEKGKGKVENKNALL